MNLLKPLMTVGFVLAIMPISTQAAWKEDEHRLNTPLQVSSYNRIASRYLETATSVVALKMGGKETIGVEPSRATSVYFSVDHVDEYLQAIEKYISWQEQATKEKDAFTKQIADVKNPMAGTRNRFGFHSGNAEQHYMTVETCVMLFRTCNSSDNEKVQLYNLENAKELALLLQKLKAGEIKPENVADKYQ